MSCGENITFIKTNILSLLKQNLFFIFPLIDVTRPKSRQPEAKGWKWGLDQSYKQTFQIIFKKQQVTELHILVTQWTIIDSHWKPGKNPWRLSFSDILPNALLSRSFVLFSVFFFFFFLYQDHCFMLMQLLRRFFFLMTEKTCLQLQHIRKVFKARYASDN